MITEQDLQEAIAECKGRKNPDAKTCMMLAAFYTIKDHLFPDETKPIELPDNLRGYSYAPTSGIDYDGESEFAAVINGRDPAELWPLLEELVETIRVLNPRLYNSFMRRVKE